MDLLELTLFLSASQQKGWLGQMSCHNFIDLRKRARLNIIAIKKLVESDFFSKKKKYIYIYIYTHTSEGFSKLVESVFFLHSTCTSGFVRTYPFFVSFTTKGMVRPNGLS